MANEIKLAKAARAVARELMTDRQDPPYPFGSGHVFRMKDGVKTPCCVIGQVIHRAGLTDLVKGRPRDNGQLSYSNSSTALEDVCGVASLAKPVDKVVGDLVESNDYFPNREAVAHELYVLAELLELAAAPTDNEATET